MKEGAGGRGLQIPDYKRLKREGMEHRTTVKVELISKDRQEVQALGKAKGLAEMAAGEIFLKREDIRS